MLERRKYVRFKSTSITELKPEIPASEIRTITKDISKTGARIYSDVFLEPASYIKIMIHKEDRTFNKIKEAVVVWSKLSKDRFGEVYESGLNIPEKA